MERLLSRIAVQRVFHVSKMTIGKMSLVFAGGAQVGARPDKATIQKMLDENGQLIRVIVRYQSMGRANDALQYQQLLHRNLVYLASLADASIQQELMQQNDNVKKEMTRQELNSNQQN
uniref:SS18 N-terminal domain-containing protein n=1 Tax=Setaria digitata TaxID=48799 RepID=A0A915Q7W5_9BILA